MLCLSAPPAATSPLSASSPGGCREGQAWLGGTASILIIIIILPVQPWHPPHHPPRAAVSHLRRRSIPSLCPHAAESQTLRSAPRQRPAPCFLPPPPPLSTAIGPAREDAAVQKAVFLIFFLFFFVVDLGQLASEGKRGLSPPLHPSHTQLAKRFVLGLVLWRGAVLPESFPAQILGWQHGPAELLPVS